MTQNNFFSDLIESLVEKEKNAVKELKRLYNKKETVTGKEEKKRVSKQIESIKDYLKKSNSLIPQIVDKAFQFDEKTGKPIKDDKNQKELERITDNVTGNGEPDRDVEGSVRDKTKEEEEVKPGDKRTQTFFDFFKNQTELEKEITDLEKITIKRLLDAEEKEEEEKKKKKEKEESEKNKDYLKFASRMFSKVSGKLNKGERFSELESNLIKANMVYTSQGYFSIVLLNTVIAFFIAIFLALFFLYFNVGANPPFITGVQEPLGARLPKVIWMVFLFPLATFLFSFFYPSMEKSSVEKKINTELPFATINMAAISGSMMNPSQIFKIIIATGEYPELRKEFTKLMNQINIYGYDFVSALRKSAENTPSEKLSELYAGLANTITSGGNLSAFFNKRADNLLFEHKMEREKSTKTAETFMDIYISIVIAAPMILMLILMMMKVSGLGVSLSTKMISLIMVLAVSAINVGFLVFLHLKQK